MDTNMLSKAVVQIFISNKCINLNRKDICGKTPFMNACINRQNYVVKLHCKLKKKQKYLFKTESQVNITL